MSDTSNWDPTGEIAGALDTAVGDYGPRVLSNPQVLGNLLKDLLPDKPREASLIVSASEVDVASILSSHLQSNLDPDTAIRLTAGTLSQSRPIDPQACFWVTTQFAQALGLVSAGAGAEPQLPAAVPILADETMMREQAAAPDAPVAPAAEVAAGAAVVGAAGMAAGVAAADVAATEAVPAADATAPQWGAAAPAPEWPAAVEPAPAAPEWGAAAAPAAPEWGAAAAPAAPPPSWDQAAAGGYPAAPPTYAAGQVGYPPAAQAPGATGYGQPGYPAAGPPTGPPQAAMPGGPSGPKKRSPALLGVLGAVALVAIYFIVAAIAKLPPLKASSSTTSLSTTTLAPTTTGPPTTTLPPTTTSVNPTTTSTAPPTTTSPPTTIPPGSGLPITTLMPDQLSTDRAGNIKVSSCVKVSPLPSGLVGVAGSLACTTIPGYKGWSVFGYKFVSRSDFSKSFAAYDKDKGFNESTASSSCPPTGTAGGATGWNSKSYPQVAGQTLQCLFVEFSNSSVKHVDYIWTLPTQDAFFELVGAGGVTGQQVETWWERDGNPGHT